MKTLLVGTGNLTRLAYVKGILKELEIQVVGLNEVGITQSIEETGTTPLENSLLKAKAYSNLSGLPTLSIDTGLYIENFPAEKQPGLHVKRIDTDRKGVSDEEMLAYYIKELEKHGGESDAHWEIGLTLAFKDREPVQTLCKRATRFTPIKAKTYTVNEPLNSIQIDCRTGKYVSDLSVEEKIQSQLDLVNQVHAFVDKNMR